MSSFGGSCRFGSHLKMAPWDTHIRTRWQPFSEQVFRERACSRNTCSEKAIHIWLHVLAFECVAQQCPGCRRQEIQLASNLNHASLRACAFSTRPRSPRDHRKPIAVQSVGVRPLFRRAACDNPTHAPVRPPDAFRKAAWPGRNKAQRYEHHEPREICPRRRQQDQSNRPRSFGSRSNKRSQRYPLLQ